MVVVHVIKKGLFLSKAFIIIIGSLLKTYVNDVNQINYVGYKVYVDYRGVATNNGRFKLGPFLDRKYKRGIKESNVSSSC